MAIVAVVLSVSLCACSDDDDDDDNGTVSSGLESQLQGTAWKVISDTDDDYNTGSIFTFNKDKSLTVSPADWWWTDSDYKLGYEWGSDWEDGVWWSVDGDVLTIDWNHDDCTEGTFIIDGNTATYTYRWYDYDGEWENSYYDTMILEKQ